MKELTVISGKGGTGKTSLVASFAALAENILLADCDVDAADLHLILKPQIQEQMPFVGGKKASIDSDQCAACETCHGLCSFGAVSADGPLNSSGMKTCRIDLLTCEGCGVCAHFCEAKAIRLEDAVQGEWFVSETRHGPLVHARLGIAAENSGKLVSLIRRHAMELAEERSLDLVIVDGSPGIGCPVIASITGSDLVLIVTEPTLPGRHDLERVVELADHFRIPVLVAVNKWDVNEALSHAIEEWCAGRGIKVAGKIPYSEEFTEAIIAGESIVEHCNGSASRAVADLWEAAREALHLE